MKSMLANTMVAALALVLVMACKPAEEPVEETAEETAALLMENAWIRPAPPGMSMTAAYGTLRNVTGDRLGIESFSGPALGHVSLHRTRQVGGVSSMQEINGIALGPGGSLEMEPGGYHLMIMLQDATLSEGQEVSLHIHTNDGRTFTFEVPVEKR